MSLRLNSTETAFAVDRLSHEPGMQPPSKQSETEALFAARCLELALGASVLDAPCGIGRHAVVLAEAGFKVTALDGDPQAIEAAQGLLGESSATVQIADLFAEGAFAPEGHFDGAISLYSCLGYSCDIEADRRFLRHLRSNLKPNSKFVLGTANRTAIFAFGDTQEVFTCGRFEVERTDLPQEDVGVLERRFVMRTLPERATGEDILSASAPEKSFMQRRRLYSPVEVMHLLSGTGFIVELLLKPFEFRLGDPVNDPHLIYVARCV